MNTTRYVLYFLVLLALPMFFHCADTDDPTDVDSGFGTEAIPSNDKYIVFGGALWSNVTFPHLEHSQREADDCFICHDHGATFGDSKWNCSACHTANDPESLCDQDANHGCIMAQCDFCHAQRGGAAPSTACSGEEDDVACCVDCHTGGLQASSGVLLDSAVEGATYRTPTISGTTNSAGRFYYQEGERVTFSIGGLLLGQTTGRSVLTILDIVDGATDVTDQQVTNICRLLLTLDYDGDPENGITLTQTILDVVRGRHIDFDQSPETFAEDQEVTALIDTLNAIGVFETTTARTLCPQQEAQDHLSETITSVNRVPMATFPGNLAVSGSSGCNAIGCHAGRSSANGVYQIDTDNYPDGLLNGKPVYKNTSTNHWIHWNTAGQTGEWKLADRTDRTAAEHVYSHDRTGGENDYPPLGQWPCGCATAEGRQISATITPLGGITGHPWVGEELTGVYHYYDDEGDEEENSLLQWYRCEDGQETNDMTIEGATGLIYTLTAEDVQSYIRFGVTPVSDEGNSPGAEIKSTALGPVIVNQVPTVVNVAVSGDLYVGTTLTGSYDYQDDIGDTESGSVYSWYRSEDASGTAEALIQTGSSGGMLSYIVANEDEGMFIRFSVTPGAATGSSPGQTVTTAWTGPIVPNPQNQVPSASVPTISAAGGSFSINALLTASYTYADAEDDPESSTYQWYQETAAGSGLFEVIAGATTLTLMVTDDCDEGKAVKFAVTPGATTGNSPGAVQESAAIVLQVDPANDAPVVTVSIETPVYVGFNADIIYQFSDDENNADRSAYQWVVCDDAAGTTCGTPVLSGALTTSVTSPALYTATDADEGKYLKIVVTPQSACGNSPGTAVESSLVQVMTNPDDNRPPSVSTVWVSGDMEVGASLQGQYVYLDPDIPPDADCSTYRWYRSDSADGAYTAVDGATTATFTPPDNGVFENGYIQFGVTPRACEGANNINPQESRSVAFGPLAYSRSNQPPTASDVSFIEETIPSGQSECLCVNSGLIGTYTYSDPEGAPENLNATAYAWYLSDDDVWTSEDYALPVSTDVRYSPPDSNYEGQWLRFGVRTASQWGNPALGAEVLSPALQIGPDRDNEAPVAIMPSGIRVALSETGAANGAYHVDDSYPSGRFNGAPIYKHETQDYWICYSGNNYWMIVNDPLATEWTSYDYYNDPDNYFAHYYQYNSDPTPPFWYWIPPTIPGMTAAVTRNSGITGTYAPVYETEETINGTPGTMPVGQPNNPWAVGATLTAEWTYEDTEGDAQAVLEHSFQWHRCNADGSSCIGITGATAESYVPVTADAGYYLKFAVTPAALSGNSPGQTAESQIIGPVERMTVLTGEFQSGIDVDYWTFYVDQESAVEIIAHAKEPCGNKTMPNDFFNDGARNNMIVNDANAVFWFFPSDADGIIPTGAAGTASYEAPGAHSTLAGYTPYLIFPGRNPEYGQPDLEALQQGWYTIAIAPGNLTEDEARNHQKVTAAENIGYYHIYLTITSN